MAATGKKKDKFKEWLSRFFAPKDGERYMVDGPQRREGQGSFFNRAGGVAIRNSPMTSVQGDYNTVTYVQGDRDIRVAQIMKLLSDHIILGAAHDDSARVPPPRCHPETRINLIARITAWFHDKGRHELLLWITGPAGVGKSAVVQTFAEYLFKSKLLGASVFCSRPNKRNNPHRIFITIAYQLSIRIEAYREFVVERLSLDPQLLNRDMATQFETFIVEPFVEKKIGAGGKRWGILLDGLDELEGEDAQCEIIQLISTFILKHRGVPLIWIVASRPESHIANIFDDGEVRQSHWSEHIPIDSTEACADVERFLRSSFKAIQKKYRHSIFGKWPSDTEFLKITAAASGLFIYAEVVMQFVRDPSHADPVSRLEVLLLVIDHSNAVPSKDNPFVHLDALYKEILCSILPTQWPIAKQFLRFAIQGEQIRLRGLFHVPRNFQTLRGMSILLGVNRHVIYACFNKCRSTLKIPDRKVAHKEKLMFLHASFADYLKDSGRSGEFHIGNDKDIEDDMAFKLCEIWNKCSGDDIATALVGPTWHQNCSKWDDKPPSGAITKFNTNLFNDIVFCLRRMMFIIPEKSTESPIFAQLREVNMIKLSYYFDAEDLLDFVYTLQSTNVDAMRLLRKTHLNELQFRHLDWKEMSPGYATSGSSSKRSSKEPDWILHRPHSSVELKAFLSELESLQKRLPELDVLIVGGVPHGQVATFYHTGGDRLDDDNFMYYIIPYHE